MSHSLILCHMLHLSKICTFTDEKTPTICDVLKRFYGVSIIPPVLRSHWSLMTSKGRLAQNQNWPRQLFVAYSAPSHCLNQCWRIADFTHIRNMFQIWVNAKYFSRNCIRKCHNMHKSGRFVYVGINWRCRKNERGKYDSHSFTNLANTSNS